MNNQKYAYLLKAAFDTAPLGSWEWDLINNVIHLSDEVMSLFEIDKDEFDGTVDFIRNNVFDEINGEIFMDNIRHAVESGKFSKHEYQMMKEDGTMVWFIINGFALKNDFGVPIQLVGTTLDITAFKSKAFELNQMDSFYQSLMDTIPEPIYYKDLNGVYEYCNKAYKTYVELNRDQIFGSTIMDLFSSTEVQSIHDEDLQMMLNGDAITKELTFKKSNNETKCMVLSKSSHFDEQGNVIGMVGIMHDITTRKKNVRLIDKQNLIKDVIIDLSQRIGEFDDEGELYHALIEQLLDVFEHADSGTVLNITEDRHFTITASSQYDKNFIKDFEIDMESSFIWHETGGVIRNPGIVNHIDKMVNKFEIPDLIPMESQGTLKCNLFIPLIRDNQLDKIVSLDSKTDSMFTSLDLEIASYIQEQILIILKLFELNQKTISLSRYDGLTGLMNRHYFEAVFEDRISLARRTNLNLSLVLFDLDDLKKLNDESGHAYGDEYIKQFANLMKKSFRTSDQVARIGGDEFCCTFMNTEKSVMIEKLEEVRKIFSAKLFSHEDSDFIGRFSFGIASYPDDGITTFELYNKADMRMYEDKRQYKENRNS